MTPSRARFVTVCQQLLALGVVVVAMAPATRVINLDVVGVQPGSNGTPGVEKPRVSLSAAETRAHERAQDHAERAVRRAAERVAAHSEAAGRPLGLGDRVETLRVGP
jgi:hypothetical protein